MFTFRSDILAACTWLILRFLCMAAAWLWMVLLAWSGGGRTPWRHAGERQYVMQCGVVWLWRCGEAGQGGFPAAFACPGRQPGRGAAVVLGLVGVPGGGGGLGVGGGRGGH